MSKQHLAPSPSNPSVAEGTSEEISHFFDKYQEQCEKLNGGPVHIPKPDPKNGAPGQNIILMFVNERPGRVGPGQTDLVSFDNPDPTAYRFKRLFEALWINRRQIFITNACIYYPLRRGYTDTRPTKGEINHSAEILEDQIRRVDPKIVVPLGNTALHTLRKFIPELRRVTLRSHVGTPIRSTRGIVFPVYHTSNRAATTRKEVDQERDWRQLKRVILKL